MHNIFYMSYLHIFFYQNIIMPPPLFSPLSLLLQLSLGLYLISFTPYISLGLTFPFYMPNSTFSFSIFVCNNSLLMLFIIHLLITPDLIPLCYSIINLYQIVFHMNLLFYIMFFALLSLTFVTLMLVR